MLYNLRLGLQRVKTKLENVSEYSKMSHLNKESIKQEPLC